MGGWAWDKVLNDHFSLVTLSNKWIWVSGYGQWNITYINPHGAYYGPSHLWKFVPIESTCQSNSTWIWVEAWGPGGGYMTNVWIFSLVHWLALIMNHSWPWRGSWHVVLHVVAWYQGPTISFFPQVKTKNNHMFLINVTNYLRHDMKSKT